MKQLFAVFLIALTVVSCGNDSSSLREPNDDQTPTILMDDGSNTTRFSLRKTRNGSILDEIYFEIIEKDKELVLLDSTIRAYLHVNDTLFANFKQYDDKSDYYYNQVMHKRGKMQDTLLSAQLDSIIAKSMKRYDAITKETDTLIYQVKDLTGDISDRYHFLKVMITLPVIEKYQSDHHPSNKPIEKYLREQQEVKSKINEKAKIN